MGPNGTDRPNLNRTSVVHPVWCSLPLCTAQLTPTVDEYRGAAPGTNYGRHLSKPLAVDLASQVEVTLSLSQAVAPWATTVYVTLTAGTANLSIPVGKAKEFLGDVGRLVSRTEPPDWGQARWAAENATWQGSPAFADDDGCPVHDTSEWTTWLGEDDEQNNVWLHNDCGCQWRTKVRRPGNGVPYVLVLRADADNWEIRCIACGFEEIGFRSGAAADGAADAHRCEREAAR